MTKTLTTLALAASLWYVAAYGFGPFDALITR